MATPDLLVRRSPGGGAMRSVLLVVLGMLLLVATIVVFIGFGSAPSADDLDLSFFGVLFAGLWAYWILGSIIVLRADGHANGWLFVISAVMMGTVFACYALSFLLTLGVSADPRVGWFGLLGAVLFTPAIILLLPSVAIVYPEGGLPGPRWRWPVGVVIVMVVVRIVAIIVKPGPMGGDGGPLNPLTPVLTWVSDDMARWLATVDTVGALSILVAFAVGIAAVVHRVRHARGDQRQQMKWFLAAMVPAAILLPLSLNDTTSSIPFVDLLSVATLPLAAAAVALAILRYRLYEIDRIISRTLGWAIVTGILVAVFAGLVVALQAVLAPVTSENTLAVAASTLAAFALFQPLRRRVQRVVDRRFDRARYDGERTVTAFGSRLRDRVELTAIRDDVLGTVDTVVRPSSAELWLRGPEAGGAR